MMGKAIVKEIVFRFIYKSIYAYFILHLPALKLSPALFAERIPDAERIHCPQRREIPGWELPGFHIFLHRADLPWF